MLKTDKEKQRRNEEINNVVLHENGIRGREGENEGELLKEGEKVERGS